ncbi:MAG: hypothetical protein FWC15_06495, partial [Fibromonadales bacterium]|nr:hypothetical protein [Fibromonadales bacterium]
KTIKHNVGSLPVQIMRADFFSLPPCQNALLVLNPPYGKRLGKEKNLYREIVKKIEKDFKECSCAIVCPANESVEELNCADKVYSYNGGVRIAIWNFLVS